MAAQKRGDEKKFHPRSHVEKNGNDLFRAAAQNLTNDLTPERRFLPNPHLALTSPVYFLRVLSVEYDLVSGKFN